MNLRLRAYDLILKTLVAITTTLIVSNAYAATDNSDVIEDLRQPVNDIVEKMIPIEPDAPYKYRRDNTGITFGLGVENIEMINYVSIIDFATTYHDMFGASEIPVYGIQLGYKYNFSLGSISANAGFGYGTLTSDISGTNHTMDITKYSVSASYVMDALFDEPYVAPYVSAGINQFNIEEKNGTNSFSTGIEAAPFYTVGLLFQLNWLDKKVSRRALIENGLENTYVDVFLTQLQPSLDSSDPNTETEYTLGAGLRLEF